MLAVVPKDHSQELFAWVRDQTQSGQRRAKGESQRAPSRLRRPSLVDQHSPTLLTRAVDAVCDDIFNLFAANRILQREMLPNAVEFGSEVDYQRLPQLPPHPCRHPPPPRTSLMTNNSNSAPMVALIIADMRPE